MGAGGKLPILGSKTFLGPGKGLELPQLPLKAQQLLMALPRAPSSLPGKEIPGFNFLRILWLLPFPSSLAVLFLLWEDTVLSRSSAPGKSRLPVLHVGSGSPGMGQSCASQEPVGSGAIKEHFITSVH